MNRLFFVVLLAGCAADPVEPTGPGPLRAVEPAGAPQAGLTFYEARPCAGGAPAPGVFTESRAALGIDFVHEPEPPPEDDGPLMDFGGIGVADLDGDDLLDLYFTNAGGPDRWYLTGGRGPAMYQPHEHTLEARSHFAVILADVDGDGDNDALVGQDRALWLENDGGRFVAEHPIAPGEVADEHLIAGFAAGDTDGDGWLDVLVAVHSIVPDGDDRDWPGREWLLTGSPEGLVDASSRLPVRRVEDWTFLASMADLDDDGDLDIYEFNDAYSLAIKGLAEDDWERQGNRLLRNDGGGAWTDLTDDDGGGAVVRTAMGGAFGDYDNDGLLDMYVTTMLPESNALLRNDGDMTFSDVTFDADADTLYDEHDVGWGAVFLDADMDGREDLYVAHGWLTDFDFEIGPSNGHAQRNVLLRNTAEGFVDVSAEARVDGWGWSRSTVVGDLNRDGFPDLVVSNANGAPDVYLNGCDDRPWLTVRLRAPLPNRAGIGARVRVTAGATTLTRQILAGGTGLYGSSAPEAYFGLPAGTETVDLEVRWPGGTIDQWTGVPVRYVVEAARP